MTVRYFIDSENVGDFWISLLDLPAEQTELIVFYTRNSPHMSYDSLIRLRHFQGIRFPPFQELRLPPLQEKRIAYIYMFML